MIEVWWWNGRIITGCDEWNQRYIDEGFIVGGNFILCNILVLFLLDVYFGSYRNPVS